LALPASRTPQQLVLVRGLDRNDRVANRCWRAAWRAGKFGRRHPSAGTLAAALLDGRRRPSVLNQFGQLDQAVAVGIGAPEHRKEK
jgi:hypothetical protein